MLLDHAEDTFSPIAFIKEVNPFHASERADIRFSKIPAPVSPAIFAIFSPHPAKLEDVPSIHDFVALAALESPALMTSGKYVIIFCIFDPKFSPHATVFVEVPSKKLLNEFADAVSDDGITV